MAMPISPTRTRFAGSSVLIAACTFPSAAASDLTVRTGPPGCRPFSLSVMSQR